MEHWKHGRPYKPEGQRRGEFPNLIPMDEEPLAPLSYTHGRGYLSDSMIVVGEEIRLKGCAYFLEVPPNNDLKIRTTLRKYRPIP